MNRAVIAISFAAALLGMSVPALADGDPYYSNGINPSGVRTPVPAPIPVPVDESEWYFRGDFAAGFGGTPTIDISGYNLVESIFGPVKRSSSFEPSFTGGVGVGYVWGPHVRTDLTVDIHSIMHSEISGEVFGGLGAVPPVYASDEIKYMSTIVLLNAYYDFRTGTPWTPYLGGGLGFTVNQLTRNLSYTNAPLAVAYSSGDRSTDVQFAAAAMAGVSYDISTFVAVDVNYRFLYIGGSEASFSDIGLLPSTVSVGGIGEHQIRAGLRFMVN